MKIVKIWLTVFALGWAAMASAGQQDRFDLPEPYRGWERQYLQDFPDAQRVMDKMVEITMRQLEDAEQDILHNRVCAALAYRMATETGLPRAERRLAVIADILHNIGKEDKKAVLSDARLFDAARAMVARLRQAGHFADAPAFWADETVLKNAKIGNNRGLIHHVTSALDAGAILTELGGFAASEIELVQAAITEHSTGYWYFRDSVDSLAGAQGAWKAIYPEPRSAIAKLAHDADLISQFVPESVIPDGSKWRALAAGRWGAKGAREEAHVVYYVFFRLFEEARTEIGRKMALEKWEQIRPELIKLMELGANDDPIKSLGVPKPFQKS